MNINWKAESAKEMEKGMSVKYGKNWVDLVGGPDVLL